jgi:hypothetical protein
MDDSSNLWGRGVNFDCYDWLSPSFNTFTTGQVTNPRERVHRYIDKEFRGNSAVLIIQGLITTYETKSA